MAVRPDSRRDLGRDRRGPFDQLVIELDRHAQQHAATLRVHGEIDFATAPALQGALEAMLGEDVERLILDLTGVEFCDVSGLNLLLRIQSQLTSSGGHLTVLAACRPLRIMVSVLGLEGRLPLTPPAADDGTRKDASWAALAVQVPHANYSTNQPRRRAGVR